MTAPTRSASDTLHVFLGQEENFSLLSFLTPEELAALSRVNRAARSGILAFSEEFDSKRYPILSRNIESAFPAERPRESPARTLKVISSAMGQIGTDSKDIAAIYQELVFPTPGPILPANPYDYAAWEEAIKKLRLKVFRLFPEQEKVPVLAKTVGPHLLTRPREDASLAELKNSLASLLRALTSTRAIFSQFLTDHKSKHSLEFPNRHFAKWESVLKRIYRGINIPSQIDALNEKWLHFVEHGKEVRLLAQISGPFHRISGENLNTACRSLWHSQKLNALKAIIYSDRFDEINANTINTMFIDLPDAIVESHQANFEEVLEFLLTHRLNAISGPALNLVFSWVTRKKMTTALKIILHSPRFADIGKDTIYLSIGEASLREFKEGLDLILEKILPTLPSPEELNGLINRIDANDLFFVVLGAHAAGQFDSISDQNIARFFDLVAESSWWNLIPQIHGTNILQRVSLERIELALAKAAKKADLHIINGIYASNRSAEISSTSLDHTIDCIYSSKDIHFRLKMLQMITAF